MAILQQLKNGAYIICIPKFMVEFAGWHKQDQLRVVFNPKETIITITKDEAKQNESSMQHMQRKKHHSKNTESKRAKHGKNKRGRRVPQVL